METIKKNQSEMKNIWNEEYTLKGINSRADETEDQINNMKDKVAENAQSE